MLIGRDFHFLLGKFQLRLRNNVSFRPQLIMISGSTGTGKTTFGMNLALNYGIDKCISTDTIREVLRTSKPNPKFDPADPLYRSSYDGDGDPLVQWRECCDILDPSIGHLIRDSINRGVSLILEGVHVVPSSKYIDLWQTYGGVGIGIVLNIRDPEIHKEVLAYRGRVTRKGADRKLKAFPRIRAIHEEMLRLGSENSWIVMEQQIDFDPLNLINDALEDKLVELFRE